jgi:hypothetical protein
MTTFTHIRINPSAIGKDLLSYLAGLFDINLVDCHQNRGHLLTSFNTLTIYRMGIWSGD